MVDEASDSTTTGDGTDDLIEEAWELIELSGFHHGQMLRAGGS